MMQQYQHVMLKFENLKFPCGYGSLQIGFGIRGPGQKILGQELI